MSMERERLSQEIDRYLDGMLTAAERAEFDRRLKTDKELAGALSLQERIDATLRGRFAPPAVIEATIAAAAKRPAPSRPIRIGAGLAAAAAIAIAGYVAWPTARQMLGLGGRKGPTPIHFVQIGAGEAYRAQVDGGMKPEWVCKDDAEFAATLEKAIGQSLVVAAAPGLEVIGWSYNPIEGDKSRGVFSGYTMYLLTRVQGEPVVVMIDRTAYDKPVEVEGDSGLHVFRRQIGDAVFYEVSPLESPKVLERFTPYEQPSGE
jgi:hypothetical protein